MSVKIAWTAAAAVLVAAVQEPSKPSYLWELGKEDRDTREFALAPKGYEKYREDGFFAVGESDPRTDWPYVHPGPSDSWAGSRAHAFTILFGLEAVTPAGEARLEVALADTHPREAPRLKIRVNGGRPSEHPMPPGAGDDSVKGQPEKGKPHRFQVAIPASALRRGTNEIEILNDAGSWVLYDWIGLAAPPGTRLGKVDRGFLLAGAQPLRALAERDGRAFQPVVLTVRGVGGGGEGVLRADGAEVARPRLGSGIQTVEVLLPAVNREKRVSLTLEAAGRSSGIEAILRPVKRLTVYILPHSHTDIGYTEIQTAIEKKQVENLLRGIEIARRTADYPDGARFVWNVEVLWAADLYLRRLDEPQRAAFREAVQKGQVGLEGMYLNELTGLCRPEELVRLFRPATVLAERCGTRIESAMISDVPGCTWGTVTALAHAGIRYFSVAPNFFDRIGDILVRWTDKPFWWVSPCGRERVLVWIPYQGYALSMVTGRLTPKFVDDYQAHLESSGYPYEIAHIRWAGHGDNAVPDPAICEFVKEWSSKYRWPRFVISTTREAFSAFERRYGALLPAVRGDWTPYWEDGAGSSARETAMNRESSERLAQAEALFAIRRRGDFPAGDFEEAWNRVLLYSEHTWGAHCSVSDPEHRMTREQWEIKRGYALEADRRSRELLRRALGGPEGEGIDVWNTASWPRTDLVLLPKELSAAGDRVTDAAGRPVPAQRLSTGELAFLASDVPPLGARRYRVSAGEAHAGGTGASASGATVGNGLVRVRLDERTGAVAELAAGADGGSFVDAASGHLVNDYLYFVGDDPARAERNGEVRISVGEKGPLVASLRVESAAPGCHRLVREVRVVAGLNRVELVNLVDKKRHGPEAPPRGFYKRKEGKESLNFAFPFQVQDGVLRLDIPFGVIVPWKDQMPGACKNWFTVGRWADVSNDARGITWVTMDAPLVQVGGLTANLLESQSNPEVWRKTVEPTQKLYSWAMNNQWGTNYRAYQEGPVTFRYVLRPHGRFDPAEAARFAWGRGQPLLAAPASGAVPAGPLLRVGPAEVLVTALKPSDDGRAWIVRLWGASGEDREAELRWSDPAPVSVFRSDTSERPGPRVTGKVRVPGFGLVTLRAERP